MKINLERDQKLFITSDTHYGHSNICAGSTKWSDTRNLRNYSSLEEMNAALVDGINQLVGENDILIHLGDWSFGGFDNIKQFRDRIVCKTIHLFLGNHDHHILNDRDGCRSLFTSVSHYDELTVKWHRSADSQEKNTTRFVLMHFPIASWENMQRGVIHLHGHVHLSPSNRIGPGRMMDVGVEGNGMKPLEFREILRLMRDRPVKGLMETDHHEQTENYI